MTIEQPTTFCRPRFVLAQAHAQPDPIALRHARRRGLNRKWWYLRHRIAVLDVRSSAFQRAREEVLSTRKDANVCLRRLTGAGRIRRIRGPVCGARPGPRDADNRRGQRRLRRVPHDATTDAALAHHGLIDQPIPTITVVLSRVRRRFKLDAATTIRPVTRNERRICEADAYETTVEGFSVRVAPRVQAVIDALAEPTWMVHGDLLSEVLAAVTDAEVARAASGALDRTTAAAQRLGYLLEEAGRPLPASLSELRPIRAVQLRPQKHARGPYSSRWRVYG